MSSLFDSDNDRALASWERLYLDPDWDAIHGYSDASTEEEDIFPQIATHNSSGL